LSSVDAEFALTCLAAMLSPTTLTCSVFVLVLAKRPGRAGAWFFLGAFGATLAIGILAAFVLGDAAAAPKGSSEPPTWVAVFDVVAAVLLLVFVVRLLRRPRDPAKEGDTLAQMRKVASSPAIAILGAGAMLANPGAFIPIALKQISQLNPSSAGYVALWTGFALVALLPLVAGVLALIVSPDRASSVLNRARAWLERHARTLGAVLIVALAAALLRNGISGLTS